MYNNSQTKEVLIMLMRELGRVSNINDHLNLQFKLSQLVLVDRFVTSEDGAILMDESLKAMMDEIANSKSVFTKFKAVLKPIANSFNVTYSQCGDNECVHIDDREIAQLFLAHDLAEKVSEDSHVVSLLEPAIKSIKWAFAIRSVKHIEPSSIKSQTPSPMLGKEEGLSILSGKGFEVIGDEYESKYSDDIETSVTVLNLVKVVNY